MSQNNLRESRHRSVTFDWTPIRDPSEIERSNHPPGQRNPDHHREWNDLTTDAGEAETRAAVYRTGTEK
jgi:hypothetical protein